ncbi:MAG: hypothetical protein ABJZ55_15025 [Fuerstiella sp.]
MTTQKNNTRRGRGVLPDDLPAMGGWKLFRRRHFYQRGNGKAAALLWIGICLAILAQFILVPVLWHSFFAF